MTFEQIKELIDIVCKKGLHELEVERSDFRVKIVGYQAAPAAVAAPIAAPVAPAGPAPAGPVEVVAEAESGAGHTVTSPIVGTFYTAPSPEADAYVKVGDRVRRGQVLCIVEAMKLMNEIESDVDGEVVEIFPANAQPVEFGEPLFGIRPEG